MSWAEEKARESSGALRKGGPGTTVNAMGLEMIVRRAIRETIEKCAEVTREARSDGGFMTESGRIVSDRAEAAIRRLAEP